MPKHYDPFIYIEAIEASGVKLSESDATLIKRIKAFYEDVEWWSRKGIYKIESSVTARKLILDSLEKIWRECGLDKC